MLQSGGEAVRNMCGKSLLKQPFWFTPLADCCCSSRLTTVSFFPATLLTKGSSDVMFWWRRSLISVTHTRSFVTWSIMRHLPVGSSIWHPVKSYYLINRKGHIYIYLVVFTALHALGWNVWVKLFEVWWLEPGSVIWMGAFRHFSAWEIKLNNVFLVTQGIQT